MPPPDQQWSFIQGKINKIKAKDKKIIALKVKYGQAKIILRSHGLSLSGHTSSSRASSNNNHRFRSRIDTVSSGGSAHPRL